MEIAESRSIEDIVTNGYEVREWDYIKEGWRIFKIWPLGLSGIVLGGLIVAGIGEWVFPILSVFGIGVGGVIGVLIACFTWAILRQEVNRTNWFVISLQVVGRIVLLGIILQFIDLGLEAIVDFASWENENSSQIKNGFSFPQILVGFLLFVVSTYLETIFFFSQFLIFDRRMKVWESMNVSFKVVSKDWWAVFYFWLISGVIVFLPVVPFYLGYFWILNSFPDTLPSIVIGESSFLKGLGSPFSKYGQGLETDLVMLVLGSLLGSIVSALWFCILAVAYADIFGLQRSSQIESPSPVTPTP